MLVQGATLSAVVGCCSAICCQCSGGCHRRARDTSGLRGAAVGTEPGGARPLDRYLRQNKHAVLARIVVSSPVLPASHARVATSDVYRGLYLKRSFLVPSTREFLCESPLDSQIGVVMKHHRAYMSSNRKFVRSSLIIMQSLFGTAPYSRPWSVYNLRVTFTYLYV